MERKKWTPKVEITDALLKFREKRKWQLALRRYVIEQSVSVTYAYYFGLSINEFRNWIEIQFTEGLNWDNFGSAWQFDHILPVAYFDFSIEEELKLCWNFINIRVGKINADENTTSRIDILNAKPYFEALHNKTSYSLCLKMINKISQLQQLYITEHATEMFIINKLSQLEALTTFNKDEFNGLNEGMSIDDIILEREILKKFG